MKTTYTEAMLSFVTDEQLLECLILYETRKMDAAKLLKEYMFPKWQVTTLEAVRMLMNCYTEFQQPNP